MLLTAVIMAGGWTLDQPALANNSMVCRWWLMASGCKKQEENEWTEKVVEEIRLGREVWVDPTRDTCCPGETDDALEF